MSRKLLLAALLLCSVAQAQIHDRSKRTCFAVRGEFVPDCNGTVCEQGRVTGDLRGRFTMRTDATYPAGAGWLYEGWTRIDLKGGKGRMEWLHEGTLPTGADRGPEMSQAVQVLVLVDGTTGAFQDHEGRVVLAGGHQAGQPAPYVGRLCRPR